MPRFVQWPQSAGVRVSPAKRSNHSPRCDVERAAAAPAAARARARRRTARRCDGRARTRAATSAWWSRLAAVIDRARRRVRRAGRRRVAGAREAAPSAIGGQHREVMVRRLPRARVLCRVARRACVGADVAGRVARPARSRGIRASVPHRRAALQDTVRRPRVSPARDARTSALYRLVGKKHLTPQTTPRIPLTHGFVCPRPPGCACPRRLSGLVCFAGPAEDAKIPFMWARKRTCRSLRAADTSSTRATTSPGAKPCCATVERYLRGRRRRVPRAACAPTAPAVPRQSASRTRPNVMLLISDDQGDCHYGHAGECRSTQTGTPIPAPQHAEPRPARRVRHRVPHRAQHRVVVLPVAREHPHRPLPEELRRISARPATVFGTMRRRRCARSTRPRSCPTIRTTPATRSAATARSSRGKFTGSLDDSRLRRPSRRPASACSVATTASRGAPGQPPRCGSQLAPSPYAPFSHLPPERRLQLPRLARSTACRAARPAAVPRCSTFFVWYAPRIPHQPLRSPQPVDRLSLRPPAVLPARRRCSNLGQCCAPAASCPPVVTAMNETNFGTVHEYFGNVWWMDDNVRELRQFLARESQPHCIGRRRHEPVRRRDAGASCTRHLGSSVTPDLERNTIIMYLSDNGWHLPNSKHEFTENGYRTRLIVFDPRTLPSIPRGTRRQPGGRAAAHENAGAGALDRHPADRARLCARHVAGQPALPDGPGRRRAATARTSRGHLVTTPGGPAAPESLRRALCGHDTKRSTSPDRTALPADARQAASDAARRPRPACTHATPSARAGAFCLGGHCAPSVEPGCTSNARLPAGRGVPRRQVPDRRRRASRTAIARRLFPAQATSAWEGQTVVPERAERPLHHERRLSRLPDRRVGLRPCSALRTAKAQVLRRAAGWREGVRARRPVPRPRRGRPARRPDRRPQAAEPDVRSGRARTAIRCGG